MGWLIYLISIIDRFREVFCVCNIIFGMALIGTTIGYIINKVEEEEKWINQFKKWMKICIINLIIFVSLTVFIPGSKTIAAIYLLPKIANNEEVIKIPDKAMKVLNKKLDEYLDDQLFNKKE